MKKFKKIAALVLAAATAVSAMSIGAMASDEEVSTDNNISNENVVELDGEPGDVFDLGNGVKIAILDEEMYYDTMDKNGDLSNARSKRYVWNISDLGSYDWYDSSTGKYTYEGDITLTDTYPYWRVYFENTQSSTSKRTTLAIYDSDGEAASTVVSVKGGYYYYLYATSEWYGDYYVGYYSSYALSGSTQCFRATTQSEVDYDE